MVTKFRGRSQAAETAGKGGEMLANDKKTFGRVGLVLEQVVGFTQARHGVLAGNDRYEVTSGTVQFQQSDLLDMDTEDRARRDQTGTGQCEATVDRETKVSPVELLVGRASLGF